MSDGFDENAEQGLKKPFIVVDFKNAESPQIIFNGEAATIEEAEEQLKEERGIVIDYEKNPEISIAFQDNEDEMVA